MLAVAIALGLFAFWSAVGLPIVAALRFGRHAIRNLLLAPSIGAAATLLPVFWLSRLGWPVKSTAWPVTVLLSLLSVLLYWRYRPRFDWKSFAPFAGILVLTLLLTGRPMFLYGFNWLSYANEDMANYALSAERLFNYAYSARPYTQTYQDNSDPSVLFWFFHVYLGIRTGSDLLLAWLMGITGRSPLQIFMPLILTFHMMLIASTAALIYRNAVQRLAALLTALLLTCSALTSLGTLYQLIAQVWGLSLLAATMTVVMRPVSRMRLLRIFQRAALSAFLLAALIVSYPEVLAFLGLSIIIYIAVLTVRRNAGKPLLVYYSCTAGILMLLVNSFIGPALLFFTSQLFFGVKGSQQQSYIFPYYLIPSGLANFWGMLPINARGEDPWLSMAIGAGAILLAMAFLASIWQAKAAYPVGIMTLVMLGLAAQLFFHKSDFGLFKLVMFIQPFLIGTMVTAWLRFVKRSDRGLLTSHQASDSRWGRNGPA